MAIADVAGKAGAFRVPARGARSRIAPGYDAGTEEVLAGAVGFPDTRASTKSMRGNPASVGHQRQPQTTMTKLTFKGTWNEITGKLKQKYADLTDDDLLFAEGKEEELLGRLQKRTGQTKEALRKQIEAI